MTTEPLVLSALSMCDRGVEVRLEVGELDAPAAKLMKKYPKSLLPQRSVGVSQHLGSSRDCVGPTCRDHATKRLSSIRSSLFNQKDILNYISQLSSLSRSFNSPLHPQLDYGCRATYDQSDYSDQSIAF